MARNSKESKELIQRRTEQLAQISEAIASLESHQSSRQNNRERFEVLNSVSEGMYEEIDKLTKKKPTDVATELMVEKINDLISETQELITGDTYIEKLEIFVPAGDPPELRDVLFVLRQVRQGMERNKNWFYEKKAEADQLLFEARVIKIALEIFQKDSPGSNGFGFQVKTDEIQELLGLDEISKLFGAIPDKWVIKNNTSYLSGSTFNFKRLDSIEIANYFRLS